MGSIVRRNEFEQTPLHAACVSGNIEVVQRLVQGGADTNAQDAAEVSELRAEEALGGVLYIELFFVYHKMVRLPMPVLDDILTVPSVCIGEYTRYPRGRAALLRYLVQARRGVGGQQRAISAGAFLCFEACM